MRRLAALGPLVILWGAACAPVPVPRESAFHPSDADLGITRVVHGTFILELRGARLLVDPWFHSGIVTRQGEPLGLTPATLPPLAAVLVTSDAPDRFDARALRDLAPSVPRAIGPPALRPELTGLGFRDVTGLPWWQETSVGDVAVTAVPAGDGSGAAGYVVGAGATRVYVAGATAPFRQLVDVAVAFPRLDVAILPIGGRRVAGLLQEMTPEQAAEAAVTLGATRVIPSGYAARSRSPLTWHAGDPLARFQDAMRARGLADRVLILAPGESWHYTKP